MTNSGVDLDTLTLPLNPGTGWEIFDPDSKGVWPDASARIYVATYRCGPDSVIQVGFDPELNKAFVRAATDAEGRWSVWVAIEPPPPNPEAKS
jgi:hypothetical protein